MLTAINQDAFFEKLATQSWVIAPFDRSTAIDLYQSAAKRLEYFKAAGINHSDQPVTQIRNDKIFWLESELTDLTESEKKTLDFLNELKSGLKNYFRLSLSEYECHYSFYEKGQKYVKHRDTLKQNNKRVFSFVIYLNQDWSDENGGHLIGYNDAEEELFKVAPIAGQMILFQSDLLHEVLPAYKQRYALTGWMRS